MATAGKWQSTLPPLPGTAGRESAGARELPAAAPPGSPGLDCVSPSAEEDRLRLRLRESEDALSRMERALVCSLAGLVDLRDLGTGIHSTNLAEWAIRVGKRLGLAEAELRAIEIASLLHDIGKVGISDSLLHKPEPITEEEQRELRRHPELGWAVLRALPGFEQVALMVLHHHEWVDGTGYPAGLEDERIPLGARIVAVIDAFDAMTRSRPYRPALSVDEALGELAANRGLQFDARIVDLFIAIVQQDLGRLAAGVGAAPPRNLEAASPRRSVRR